MRIYATGDDLGLQCERPFGDIGVTRLQSTQDLDLFSIRKTGLDFQGLEASLCGNKNDRLTIENLNGIEWHCDGNIGLLNDDTSPNECTGCKIFIGPFEYAARGEGAGFVRYQRADILDGSPSGVAVMRNQFHAHPFANQMLIFGENTDIRPDRRKIRYFIKNSLFRSGFTRRQVLGDNDSIARRTDGIHGHRLTIFQRGQHIALANRIADLGEHLTNNTRITRRNSDRLIAVQLDLCRETR